MLRGVLTRRAEGSVMPAWESQPAIAEGVQSLYAYLAARSRGNLGAPAPAGR